MAYLYPYGDSQQLNLSWFLEKFKELYEYVMNLDPGESSMDVILSRFTEQYDPSTTYAAGDYCIFDGYIYKANRATSGMFDSGSWDPALPVNDIQSLRILISQLSQSVEDLGEDAVTDVQYTPGASTADGLLRKTINGVASTVMTVDKEPTENSQNPVKSGPVYEELTELRGSLTNLESTTVTNNPIEHHTDSTSSTQATIYIDYYKWNHLCLVYLSIYVPDGFNTGSANRIVTTLPANVPRPVRTAIGTDINLVSIGYYSDGIVRIQNNGTALASGRAFDLSVIFYTN